MPYPEPLSTCIGANMLLVGQLIMEIGTVMQKLNIFHSDDLNTTRGYPHRFFSTYFLLS